MRNFISSLSAILIYLAAAYGWGRLAVDRFYAGTRPGWTFTLIIGLGVWIFIGGLLNAARLAFPQALDTLVGLGVGLAIAFACTSVSKNRIAACFLDWRACFRETFLSHWLPFAIIGLIFLFLVLTQMPANAFNFYDDYHVYFPRLTRMLQTGSLGGNPFDVLGVDSLGAQAFLQSFFVDHLSLSYINAFDAVACFVLGLLLLGEMGRRFGIHWLLLLASLLTFIVINPQYTNTSSLYSGSLMILATVWASIVFADDMGGADNKRAFAGAVAVALFLTSLVALKTTFAVFATTYFVVYFGCALYLSENKSRIARSLLFAVLAAMILIAPWTLLSLPNYLTALQIAIEGNAPAVTGGSEGVNLSELITAFSDTGFMGGNHLGGNYLAYGLVALLLAAAGATSLILLIKSRDVPYRRRLVAISAACVAAVISCVVNVYLFDPMNAIRYSIPILVAVASVTMLLLVRNGLPSQSQHNLKRPAAYAGGIAVLSAAVVIGGVFSDELVNRSQRAYNLRTQLSLSLREITSAFNNPALGKPAASWVHTLQHKIKEGGTILAFISVPFHLDFARNPIFIVSETGFMNPWFDFPLNEPPEVARKYLSDRGIRYVMFQHRMGPGYMIPSFALQAFARSRYWTYRELGARSISFHKVLRSLAENSHLIHADASVVIFDVSQKTLLPSAIPAVVW